MPNHTQPIRIRAGAIVICLTVALTAVLLNKHYHQPPNLTAPRTAAKTAQQILASIQTPPPNSPTHNAVVKALTQAGKLPNDPNTWTMLGDALAQYVRDTNNQGYYDQAKLTYGRALQLDPHNLGALTGLAWVEGGRHLFEQSVAWANKALEIDPDDPTAYGILGDAELELGDYDQALQHYQKMISLRPDLSSYSRSGYFLWLTGHRAKAIELMQRAIRAGAPFAENTAWCRAKLAMMLFDDGALVPAWQTLEPALNATNDNIHVLLAAGRIMTARHDYAAAIQYYRRAIALTPNIEALAAMGDIYALQGDKTKAEECYQQVETLHSANLSTGLHDHMQMARFYADHERNLIEALRMAEQFKLTRNVLQADALAWVYFKKGDLDNAAEAMNRALSHGSLDPSAYFHAGMIAAKRGDLTRARHYLATALGFNPEFSPLDAPLARKTLDNLTLSTRLALSSAAAAFEPPRGFEKASVLSR
jgi:tetratricopeptide (TPR) repeat protein